MYVLICKIDNLSIPFTLRKFGVEELIADPRGLGVLIDTSTGCPLESIAIGLRRGRSDIIRQRSLPDLKAARMRFISDAKNVDQSGDVKQR